MEKNKKINKNKNSNWGKPDRKNVNSSYSKKKEKEKEPVNSKLQKTGEGEILDWFYMCPNKIDARILSSLLTGNTLAEVELWPDMNTLELTIPETAVLYFEPADAIFRDAKDLAFLQSKGVNTVFSISFEKGSLKDVRDVMKTILVELGGFLCADSEDFMPIYNEANL